jgi:hypothetical protein
LQTWELQIQLLLLVLVYQPPIRFINNKLLLPISNSMDFPIITHLLNQWVQVPVLLIGHNIRLVVGKTIVIFFNFKHLINI